MANVTISKFSDGTNTGYIAPQSYFECSTAAATAAKTATSPDSVGFSNTSLSRGTTVFVKFTNENTAGSPTLQIGTSTAKSISGSATWSAGSVVSFTYDGTNWIQGSGDSSSSDVPVMLVTANYTYDGGGHYTFTGYSVTAPTVSELYNYTQTSGNRTINFNYYDQGEYGDRDGIEACTGEISYFNSDTPPTAVTIFAYLLGFGASEVDFQIYLTDDASTTTVTKTVYSSVTSISSSSTDTQYPTAKAVYDLFASITDADSISY